MILDLDAGNTRLKWRLSGEKQFEQGACHYEDVPQQFAALGDVFRVRVSCVAGTERLSRLAEVVASQWGCAVEVASVQEQCAGVRQGYADRAKLGVDRWLAVLAAYNELQCACLVVSCGTAITVDLVDQQGIHLGGYIVPGFEMMRQALFTGTHAVQVPSIDAVPGLPPGQSTIEAVNHGCLLMVEGLVKLAADQLHESDVPVLVTGGDAEKLLPHLTGSRVMLRELLVLDGLACALP